MSARPTKIAKLRALATEAQLRAHLDRLGIELPQGEREPREVLAEPLELQDGSAGSTAVGNRFAILPMEGWDGSRDGRPTDLVRRRWRRFGESGAKLVWGEATAVRADGRANPNQLLIDPGATSALAALRDELVGAHRERFGRTGIA